MLWPVLKPIVTPGSLFPYHHSLPMTSLLDGLILDLAGAVLAGLGVLILLARLPPKLRRVTGSFLTGVFLWGLAFGAMTLLAPGPKFPSLPKPSLLTGANLWWCRWCFRLALGVPLLFAILGWVAPALASRAARATRFTLALVAFAGLWIVPELLYRDYLSHHAPVQSASLAEAQSGKEGRIVWILFDELSWKLALNEPPPGVELPNFARLSGQSISFANIQPVGNYTDLVIPSILARRRIQRIASNPEGKLIFFDESRAAWSSYEPRGTLFDVAREEGWSQGIVGWHIPYCRIFAGLLSRCYWRGSDALVIEPWASEQHSALSNALALPQALASRLYSRSAAGAVVRNQEVDGFRELIEESYAALRDERIHLLLIHLPAPHPPGIYDRRTHQICACGNYIDNLVLADDTLGALTAEISRGSLANRTTLIVSSDHSWRVPLWRTSPHWTAEEERISGGEFDPRPVFMIHFAGQTRGREVMAPLSELVEFDVMAGMLRGKISGTQDVEDLVRSGSQDTASLKPN